MFGTSFYHSCIRKVVIAFGTLFNNIQIERKDSSGNVLETIAIPLAYGPREKFLYRINQDVEDVKLEMTLPRMSFSMDSLTYDPSRKGISVKQTKTANTTTVTDSVTKVKTLYQRVPYILNFSLNIMVKSTEDGLKIIEQILPYFTPAFNVTIDDDFAPESMMDIPFVLNGVSQQDMWDGSFRERRALIYNLVFTAQTHLYGPQASKNIITKSITQLYGHEHIGREYGVQTLTVVNSGISYDTETDLPVTGGSGLGLTVNVTAATNGEIIKAVVNNPGRGYKIGDMVAITQATASNGVLKVTQLQFDSNSRELPTSTSLDSANVRITIVPDPTDADMDDDYGFTETILKRD